MPRAQKSLPNLLSFPYRPEPELENVDTSRSDRAAAVNQREVHLIDSQL